MEDYIEISAKDAHEVALRVNDEIIPSLKSSIMNKINDAMHKGNFRVNVRCEGNPYEVLNKEHIWDEICGWLLGLGYEVNTYDEYKTTVMSVSWHTV